MLDWDDLRYFLAVARSGNLSQAARGLGVNHSTVSRRIAAFEKRLGTTLFDRLPSGYAPTGHAHTMLAQAEDIEASMQQFERQATGQDARLTGKIAVTAPAVIANYILMPMLADFRAAYPGLDIRVVSSSDVLRLEAREADVALRATNTPNETLIGHRLIRSENALYASPGYLAKRGLTPDTAAAAPDLDWVWFDGGERPEWVGRHFPGARLAGIVEDKTSLISALQVGLGIADLPRLVGDRVPGLVRLPGITIGPGRDFWVLYHRDLRHLARIRVFVDAMRKGFAALES